MKNVLVEYNFIGPRSIGAKCGYHEHSDWSFICYGEKMPDRLAIFKATKNFRETAMSVDPIYGISWYKITKIEVMNDSQKSQYRSNYFEHEPPRMRYQGI